jgi:exosortase D (VPLPA-CTERM-specific)
MGDYLAPAGNKGSAGWGGRELAAFCYPLLCALCFALLFHRSYRYMWATMQLEDYSHCLFVPLIVGYLVWEKREALRLVPSLASFGGLAPLLLGAGCYALGELGGEFYTIYLGSWLILLGCLWAYAGWRKLKIVLFPLFFLIAMFPLPNFINSNLTLDLKLISSRLGVAMMRVTGLSAYREGNLIDLGFTKLQVVDACSGLRYFFPLILLGALLAYYFRGATWKKVVLVLSAVPVSVVTNSLRIASVGYLYQFFGPVVAEGFFHDFSGWFIFMLSLGILLAEMWLLKKILPGADADPPGPAKSQVTVGALAFPTFKSRGVPAPLLVALLLLAATVFLSRGIDFRERVPASRPFDQFPLRVAGWQGVRTVMEKAYLDTLKLDDYVMVDYQDRQSRTVSLYTAYYASQSKGESIHSPATCLPGNGWLFEESGELAFPLAPGAADLRVNRAFMQKGGARELTYYWFPQRGRVLTSLFQMKLYTFWDALTRHRTDGALVRIITPVYGSERLADAEARLQGFTREITPVLSQFIPK